jgi:hypothetical protein
MWCRGAWKGARLLETLRDGWTGLYEWSVLSLKRLGAEGLWGGLLYWGPWKIF